MPLKTEAFSPLTPDEVTIMALAMNGESLMPIGRWEISVKSLHARGYLRANDDVNYVITELGRKAWAIEVSASESSGIELDDGYYWVRHEGRKDTGSKFIAYKEGPAWYIPGVENAADIDARSVICKVRRPDN